MEGEINGVHLSSLDVMPDACSSCHLNGNWWPWINIAKDFQFSLFSLNIQNTFARWNGIYDQYCQVLTIQVPMVNYEWNF